MLDVFLSLAFLPHYLYELRLLCLKKKPTKNFKTQQLALVFEVDMKYLKLFFDF